MGQAPVVRNERVVVVVVDVNASVNVVVNDAVGKMWPLKKNV